MSDYEQFMVEKLKLDGYVSQKFKIVGVKEDLSGAWLDLEHPGGETASLHLETANARKYYASLLIQQGKHTRLMDGTVNVFVPVQSELDDNPLLRMHVVLAQQGGYFVQPVIKRLSDYEKLFCRLLLRST